MKTRNKIFYLTVTVALLTGCMAGPDFKAPVVPVPQSYAGYYNDSTADLRWWTIFSDTTLYRLVTTALANNKDVAVAYSRVEEARLNMRATRADLYPQLNYSIAGQTGNETPFGKSPSPVQEYKAGGSIGWELDFFGKVRRATEAARDQIFATESARQSVLISLISEVATAYFTLLDYEQALDVSQSTYDNRTQSLKLVEISYAKGAVSGLDLKQAQQLQASAAAAIPQYNRAVAQTNHALSVLLGQNPGIVVGSRHTPLMSQPMPESIPAGLPSDLLERRPDIMEAYYTYAAKNAMIGVAQAMRYPTIALTGDGGLVNTELKNLFMAKSFLWTAAASVTGPIFQFGKNKRKVEIAREQAYQAQKTYEQNVLQAFQEVNDALVAVDTYKAQMTQAGILLDAAREARHFANERYIRGFSSYIDLLDADRSLYQAELNYAQVVQERLTAYVNLYKALGGGWILPDRQN